jgi:hypothetical protein
VTVNLQFENVLMVNPQQDIFGEGAALHKAGSQRPEDASSYSE